MRCCCWSVDPKQHSRNRQEKSRMNHSCMLVIVAALSLFSDGCCAHRLPGNILPVEYNIQLLPFVDNFTTDGFVEILVTCLNSTNRVYLNSANITIDQSSLKVINAKNNQELNVVGLLDDPDHEIVTIEIINQLIAGEQYKISMKFISILNDEMRGLYRSSYQENGVKKYLAVSQFAAADARRSFPCFDEPNMKANFTVAIGRKEHMSSISNMPRIGTSKSRGYVWDYYETSVKMPTYLVAIVVSEFVSTSYDIYGKVPFTVWAQPLFKNQTKYAGYVGAKVLKYFEDYLKIDYSLPKMDMIAIPDFSAGAMENWGLVTYREEYLLIDERRSSAVSRQRAAGIIAHELAHMWFGNLVTLNWWDVAWLNEGFARYMQYIGADSVEPGFQMNEQFIVATLQPALKLDSQKSSRPLNFVVHKEFNSLFDGILYDKGASVIRMCAHFLGMGTFRNALIRYLNKKAYGNVVEDDLWEALQEQADRDHVKLPTSVKTIMDTWTKKMGYPIINVTRNYSDNSAIVTQARFLMRKSHNSTDDGIIYRWWIPLTYASNLIGPQKAWMSSEQEIMVLSNIEASRDQMVIFNVGQIGYYRVVYDDINMGLISKQLMINHKHIPTSNRAQLLDDTLNIARANLMAYEKAMELTKYLEFERDYTPWTAAVNALDFIDAMFYGSKDYNLLRDYLSRLVIPLYKHVGFTESISDDSHLLILTRSHAIHWACNKLDDPDCVHSANNAYAEWMKNPDNNELLSPNLFQLIVCSAIANGGETEWNFGYQKYLNSTLASEKTELFRAITCSRNPDIINQMLELMIDPNSGFRLQDASKLFKNIAANPAGQPVALDFLINRWDQINSYFSNYVGFFGTSISGLYRSLSDRINTNEQLVKLIKLRDDHLDVLGSDKLVAQGIELAQSNVQWVEEHCAEIAAWLKKQQKATEETRPTTTLMTLSKTLTSASLSPYQQSLLAALLALVITFVGQWIVSLLKKI